MLFLFAVCGAYLALRWVERAPAPSPEKTAEEERRSSSSPTRIVGLGSSGEVELTYRFDDVGFQKAFDLALDEVAVKSPGGRSEIVKLVPAATRETYVPRLKELSPRGEVQPVLYPEGEERDPFNRRLVTSKVLVEAVDGTSRESLSGSLRLPIEMMPEASPKHVVLKASSPLAALDGLARWSALPGVKSVEVLLAKQQSKRAMPNDPLIPKQWHLKYQNQSGAVAGTDVNIESVWN
ncbi:MAG TPA: hypothetical protein VM511_01490, partial [Luteolibacter sp.]|nr:hypothetical protein [Luteolibacter sp.]